MLSDIKDRTLEFNYCSNEHVDMVLLLPFYSSLSFWTKKADSVVTTVVFIISGISMYRTLGILYLLKVLITKFLKC